MVMSKRHRGIVLLHAIAYGSVAGVDSCTGSNFERLDLQDHKHLPLKDDAYDFYDLDSTQQSECQNRCAADSQCFQFVHWFSGHTCYLFGADDTITSRGCYKDQTGCSTNLDHYKKVCTGAFTTVIVRDGYLESPDGSSGKLVGTTTSALQANVVDALFAPVNSSDWANVSFIDGSVLRTLELHGDYEADAALKLPSLFRLRLSGSITAKPGLSSEDRFPAIVELQGASYSAVIGGVYNISGGTYGAVALLDSTRCTVRGIRAMSDGNAIAVHKGSLNEIAENDVGPGPGRCIWTLATSRALVHSNLVHDCLGHALDFDAYTKHSVAYNNTCSGSTHEGIFVEETASDNTIVGNTLTKNNWGIGVYANAVGPVKGNLFIGNVVSENKGGIISGGYGHDPVKHSEDNMFVDNFIEDNGVGVNMHHGDTQGDFWVGNVNKDSWTGDPGSSDDVAVFDPVSDNTHVSAEAVSVDRMDRFFDYVV